MRQQMKKNSKSRRGANETLPSALESERALVAIAEILGEIPEVAGEIRPGHFHDLPSRIVWGTMRRLGRFDPGLLLQALRQSLELPETEAFCWSAFLAEVHELRPLASEAGQHAAKVREAAYRRGLVLFSDRLRAAGESGTVSDSTRLRQEFDLLTGDAPGNGMSRSLVFHRMTAAELDKASYNVEYLIDGVLVARQPCILAGSKKCLKTSILLDLSISLALGGCFLGRMEVNRGCRVGIMSGESGMGTIQETARRIAGAAGKNLSDISGLVFSEDLPEFGNPSHEQALRNFISNDELEVLCIDPAYMCIPDVDHSNLFQMGQRLRSVARVCQESGVLMIVAHHTRKAKGDPFGTPELEDMAWAGFQEFARQWLMVGRREAYLPGTGDHRLWLTVGGSAGHSGLWALDISEGTRDSEGGRFWSVDVMRSDEARQRRTEAQEAARREKAEATLDADRREIVAVMTKMKDPDTKSEFRERVSCGHGRFDRAFASLVDDRTVQSTTVTKGNNRPYAAWKLRQTDKGN